MLLLTFFVSYCFLCCLLLYSFFLCLLKMFSFLFNPLFHFAYLLWISFIYLVCLFSEIEGMGREGESQMSEEEESEKMRMKMNMTGHRI